MGAFERIFHKELAEATAEGRAEGRAEERQLIKQFLAAVGMSPEAFDKYIASLNIK